jgi:hypothetical protein
MIERARDVRIEDEIGRRGIRLRGQVERVGPCPVCGGIDRFGINTRKQLFHCRGCGAGGEVIALTQHLDGCDFREAIERLSGEREVENRRNPSRPKTSDTIARARQRWREAIDPRGTIVETYLAGRRLELTDDIAGEVIRFHPACPWQDDDGAVIHVPAMICAMRNTRTDDLVAVSRRRLTPQGEKVGKPKFLGAAAGAAIKLDADESVTNGLHIAEGCETGIAGRMLDLRPMWCLGSKDAIGAFPVLGGIDCLTILAEPDAEAAVEKCARRWFEAGREVIINRSKIGKDLADAVARGGARA